ncbi:MAG TPA: type II toxin-antitoxin system antitoxin SocA domain-containing protein [Candidatus Acidoferrales bacterium]|nr:type II toxin-antitoxin system antitoxin SocA domain-containing protein [Candidatus Acidoferrales bacterium]
MNAPSSTAERIASCLINLSHEKQSAISNLKLQKLLYYAQAWYLAFYKQPLFEEEIEAWVHGPVVPAVFRRYREYKWTPLDKVEEPNINEFIRDYLQEVWRVYGEMSASDLERISHCEEPWIKARAGLPPDVSSHEVISKEWMQEYYSERLHA